MPQLISKKPNDAAYQASPVQCSRRQLAKFWVGAKFCPQQDFLRKTGSSRSKFKNQIFSLKIIFVC
jgi:hypothetical protein